MRSRAVVSPPPSTGEGQGGGEAGPPRLASVETLLRNATARLVIALNLERSEARLEARVLAAHALGVPRAWLVSHGDEAPDPAAARRLQAVLARRLSGEPVAYILGRREFYGRAFWVTPDVLIPRPETELLVEAALERLPQDRPARILDLGTGSGCIAITLALEQPDCRVTAVDISPAALALAADNADRLGARVEFLLSDWFSTLGDRRFDLIVSNPPYVAEDDTHLSRGDLPHEPRTALASGPDGLDAIRRIAADAPRYLGPAGWLLTEHGYDQGDGCRAIMQQAGLEETFTRPDLAGQLRITLGRRVADAGRRDGP